MRQGPLTENGFLINIEHSPSVPPMLDPLYKIVVVFEAIGSLKRLEGGAGRRARGGDGNRVLAVGLARRSQLALCQADWRAGSPCQSRVTTSLVMALRCNEACSGRQVVTFQIRFRRDF